MNVVLFDSSLAGASGDKILSSLADAGSDCRRLEAAIAKALAATGAFTGRVRFEEVESHGMAGKRLKADLKGEPLDQDGMRAAIRKASKAAGLGDWGAAKAEETLELLLTAEGEVHGGPHIHEIGEADTLVDIVGTMKAIQMLELDGAGFSTTPIAVGSGSVECGHGKLPVPAPATLAILSKARLPITGTAILGELTTPTGAALLASLTGGYSEAPPIVAERTGVGIGNRELNIPNITRAIVSRAEVNEYVKIIETNVDDASGEVVGWLIESLQGKVEDVTVTPMLTKKNRPGYTIRVVARSHQLLPATEALMTGTGSLGVKVIECQRLKAGWRLTTKKVRIGGRDHEVRFKVSERNSLMKPEYEDLKRIAALEGLSLREVMDEAQRQGRQK